MMDATYTGKQIAVRRKELGLTQKELAARLHVTDKAVSKWERGINFPDLGLMESLAAALDTTPAILLGLDTASRDEIVSSMSQISTEQLEDTLRDVRWTGWGCIAASVLLILAYYFYGNNWKLTQYAYQLLHGVILLAAAGGIYLLFKYGEIRKWDIAEWIIFYIACFPVLIWNGYYFITGHSLHDAISLCLIAVTACMTQLLFFRIMRPQVMKALPLGLTALFAAWHLWDGSLALEFLILPVCCLAVYISCRLKNNGKCKMESGK